MSTPQSTIELDQDDLASRLQSDEVLGGKVKVFSQRKGLTENDVLTALGAMNSEGGKSGAVIIVLMPQLALEARDAPGPQYFVRYPIQIIDWPVVRRNGVGGVGISAESLAQRVRQVVHLSNFGRGQALSFDAIEPAAMNDPTKVSYIAYFKKIGSDPRLLKPAAIVFSPTSGAVPQTITLTCSTPDVDIWYTTDGSYPGPRNPSAILYTGPFTLTNGATVRASPWITAYQQGDVYQQTYTGSSTAHPHSSAMGGAPFATTALGG